MHSQPDHHDVLTALLNLCNNAITECEAELEQQRASDMAEAKRLEEEQKVRENEARMLAKQQEKERRRRWRRWRRIGLKSRLLSAISRPERRRCGICRRGPIMTRRTGRKRRAV